MGRNLNISVAVSAVALALAAPSAALAQSIEHGGDTYVAAPVNSGEAHRWSIMHPNSNRGVSFDMQCRSHALVLQVSADSLCGSIDANDFVPVVRGNGYLYDSMTVGNGRVQGTTLYALNRNEVTYSTTVVVGDDLYVIDYYSNKHDCYNVAVKRYRKVPPRQTFVPPAQPMVLYQPQQPRIVQNHRPGHTVGGQTFINGCCGCVRGYTTATINTPGSSSTQTIY